MKIRQNKFRIPWEHGVVVWARWSSFHNNWKKTRRVTGRSLGKMANGLSWGELDRCGGGLDASGQTKIAPRDEGRRKYTVNYRKARLTHLTALSRRDGRRWR